MGADNGLVSTLRQAIIWTNGYKFTDAYMLHSASMSYNVVEIVLIKSDRVRTKFCLSVELCLGAFTSRNYINQHWIWDMDK